MTSVRKDHEPRKLQQVRVDKEAGGVRYGVLTDLDEFKVGILSEESI